MSDTPARAWRAPAAALSLLLGACGSQAPAPVAVAAPTAAVTAPSLADADRRFAIDAMAFCRYQVEAGRLAEQRALTPMVKAYATLLVQQHGAALAELETLLRARGTPWTGGVPADRRTVLAALEALPAEAFERRFVEQVGVADHEAALLVFEAAARTAHDAALRAWTERTVPLLQNHLASARQLPLRVQARAAVPAELLPVAD